MPARARGPRGRRVRLHDLAVAHPARLRRPSDPSRLATFAEIDALFEALAAGGGGSAQASIGRLEWLDEFAAIARRHGIVFTWTALLSDIAGPGSHRPLLEQAHRLRADGYPVVPQTSPLPQEFEFTFDYPLPWERCDWIKPLLAAKPEARAAMWRDADFVAAFRNEELTGFDASLIDWEQRAVIAEAPHDAALNERRLAEVAHLRGVDPFDLAVELSIASGLATRFRLPVLNYREDEIAEILRDPVGVIAFSDAGAHASQLCNVHYTTHLLQHWVRETGTLTLEQGVHALTGRPAEVVGLADRGRIAEGLAADLVVFDADTIAATPLRRVHDLPAGADRMICEAPGVGHGDRQRHRDPRRRPRRRRRRATRAPAPAALTRRRPPANGRRGCGASRGRSSSSAAPAAASAWRRRGGSRAKAGGWCAASRTASSAPRSANSTPSSSTSLWRRAGARRSPRR